MLFAWFGRVVAELIRKVAMLEMNLFDLRWNIWSVLWIFVRGLGVGL